MRRGIQPVGCTHTYLVRIVHYRLKFGVHLAIERTTNRRPAGEVNKVSHILSLAVQPEIPTPDSGAPLGPREVAHLTRLF